MPVIGKTLATLRETPDSDDAMQEPLYFGRIPLTRDDKAGDRLHELKQGKKRIASPHNELQYGHGDRVDDTSSISAGQGEEDEDEEEQVEAKEESNHDEEEPDDDDELEAFRPSQGSRKARRFKGNVSRDMFRDRLQKFESADDLQLLYPPSLVNVASDEKHKIDEGASSCKASSSLEEAKPLVTTTASDDQLRDLDLRDFCIYRDLSQTQFRGQFESLHTFSLEVEESALLLDGIIYQGDHHTVIEGATITDVSIEHSEAAAEIYENSIRVQLKVSPSVKCWCKLTSPLSQYQRIWSDFVWIAAFCKYCMVYFELEESQSRSVTLQDFAADFKKQTSRYHGETSAFRTWDQQSGYRQDFRRQISMYGKFVYGQYYSLEDRNSVRSHPVWGEVGLSTSEITTVQEQTVVTRNVARTFLPSLPSWGKMLREVDFASTVEKKHLNWMQTLQIANKLRTNQDTHFRTDGSSRVSRVEWTLNETKQRNGPVECPPEMLLDKLVVVKQVDKKLYHFDYALVKQISPNRKNVRVIWLTLPANTICARTEIRNGTTAERIPKLPAFYPIGNELFLSDDCNCYTVETKHIYGVYDVSVGSLPKSSDCNFFAMTWYQEKERCFVNTTENIVRTCSKPCFRPAVPRSDMVWEGARRRRNNPDRQASPLISGASVFEDALPNVSLFTGCGLFDRALESEGLIHTTLSIDCNPIAMRSARANSKHIVDREKSGFIEKSVNAILQRIMSGDDKYPYTGCLSAGCPCPGFSNANRHKSSEKAIRDCSLLASTMSWIEVLLPAYAVIGNVPAMDSGSPSACCQAISFLVALGYQVRKLLLKASDFGGSTTRQRLFIIATAPSYTLPSIPDSTNGDHGSLQSSPMIEDMISDLSPIHNDTLINVKEPYHIPSQRLDANIVERGPNFRDIVSRIPRDPPGQGLVDSVQYLTDLQQEWFQTLTTSQRRIGSETMRRVRADERFRSVVTGVRWLCAYSGRLLHHKQHRLLSLEELARAQGVPADFVLVGDMAQQLRQIGNAVPWCLGTAIGMAISKAFELSQKSTETTISDSHATTLSSTDIEPVQEVASGSDESNRNCVIIPEAGYPKVQTHMKHKLKLSSSTPDRLYKAAETIQGPSKNMKRPYSCLHDMEFDNIGHKRTRLTSFEKEEVIGILSKDSADDADDGKEEADKDCDDVGSEG